MKFKIGLHKLYNFPHIEKFVNILKKKLRIQNLKRNICIPVKQK